MSLQSRYTVLRKIADGGTAEIFLAKQSGAQGFEKMVVLKRIFNTFYADPQFRHMLVDEAHIAMSLYHSNIVQILDLGEADGRYFLAFELVDGWTLDEVLRRSSAAAVAFPPALALYVTAEVCRALSYAHSKSRDGEPLGIVHRDISPHNVLLSEHGEVKLTDFGIAKAHNKQGQSLRNIIKGKIAFMSPEQASGGEIDARSDLFSLGTMLYVMITRRYPFEAPTDYETLMQVKGGAFIPPETARPGLNPEIYRVIRRAMGRTPAERYQSAGEMLVDVEQVMRVAFRAVGQTELVRWLADLSAKDGVPPLTRLPPPRGETPTVLLGAGAPPAARSAGSVDRGQESGVVLDLDDAEELVATSPNHVAPNHTAPPPIPAADGSIPTASLRPTPFWRASRARRVTVRVGGVALLLALGAVSVEALIRKRPAEPRRALVAAAAPAPTVTASPEAGAASPAMAPAVPSAQPGPAAAPAEQAAAPPADAAAAAAIAQAAPPRAAPAAEPPPAAPADEPEPEEGASEAEKRPGRAVSRSAAPATKEQISVQIKSDPAGSKVSIRHHTFGSTPLSLKLRPGNSYEITFAKTGYLPNTKVYRVSAQTHAIAVTLKRAKPVGAVAPRPAAPPPAAPESTESKKSWWKLRFAR
jgi:serine/threonine protein kinase